MGNHFYIFDANFGVIQNKPAQKILAQCHPGFHGVMVSTQDSESCDPSSNLGGTYPIIFEFYISFYLSFGDQKRTHILFQRKAKKSFKPQNEAYKQKILAAVGFEPTPPRRLVP